MHFIIYKDKIVNKLICKELYKQVYWQSFNLYVKYFTNKLFIDKNFYSYYFKDSDKLEDILQFRNDSIASYFMRIKRRKRKYKIRKFIAKPFIKKEKLDNSK